MLIAVSATSKTLVVAIVGIVISGLIGPAATAWATRRANSQQFDRDQKARRRDDLRTLVDEAAKLLGSGVTNLRLGREAKAAGSEEPDDVKEWGSQVHLLKQRLLLRRSSADRLILSFDGVLDSLEKVASADSDDQYEGAVTSYTTHMNAFLGAARSALDAPVL